MQSVLHLSIKHHHHHHHHYHPQQQQRHQHSHDHIIQAKEDKRMPCISGSYHTKPKIKNATQLVLYLSIEQAQHHYYRHHLDHHNLLQQKDDKRMVCIRWNIPWALARLYPKCRLATLSVGGRRIRLCTISIKEDHQRWISTAA